MKQFYLLLTACLCFAVTSYTQTRYWVGASGGQWSNAANWSATTGGSGGATVPNGSGFDVILDKNVTIEVNASFSLNSLSVTGPVKVRLHTSTGMPNEITLTSTTNALTISATSTLEDSAAAEADFGIRFANNAKGSVDGTWAFYGTPYNAGPPELFPGAAYIAFPATGFTNLLTVTGTIHLGAEGLIDISNAAYLYLDEGSRLELARDGGNIPKATWNVLSTLFLTGVVDNGPSFDVPPPSLGFGSVVIDCPNANGPILLNMPQNLLIQGNLLIANTNNQNLVLGNGAVVATMSYTVNGYVEIGNGAYVTLGGRNTANAYSLQVGGNFIIQDGGTFDLQNPFGPFDPVVNPITLAVKGDVIQNGTTTGLICTNATVSTGTELFVLELNGTSNQMVSFEKETIDNAGHQVVLRMNNSQGITLYSPLQVGKVSWNTANKGIITARGGNYLFVSNDDNSDPLVMNGYSGTGYVDGAIRRAVAGTGYFEFPSGKSTALRTAEVKPAGAASSVYEVEYFGTAYGGTVLAPLTAVSNQEYWNITKISGEDASVRLTLAAAVPGAGPTDTLVVAHYNGTNWTDVRGTKLFPGNTVTGSVESKVMSSFSPFTIAYTSTTSLPIYLVNFTARLEGNGAALLNWTITDNSTPQAFEVLRSTNGTNFTAIGTVKGEERKLHYDFTDTKVPTGTVYYRLRLIDIDGSGELTKIVAVMNGSKGVVITSMMPTLVTNRSRVQISSSENTNIQLVVTDMYGRSVLRQVHGITRGNQELWLNLGNLPSGAYQLTGYLQNGEKTSSIRFVKQ